VPAAYPLVAIIYKINSLPLLRCFSIIRLLFVSPTGLRFSLTSLFLVGFCTGTFAFFFLTLRGLGPFGPFFFFWGGSGSVVEGNDASSFSEGRRAFSSAWT